MSVSITVRTAITGGTATALDGINGNNITEGMVAFVIDIGSGRALFYTASLTSGAAADGINIVAPTTNAGTIRWIIGQIGWLDDMGGLMMPANLVKDPRLLPWFVGAEGAIGPGYAADEAPTENRWGPQVSPLSGAGAWTLIGLAGVVSQVAAADTYVTVANVTGAGILTNLFLPGVAALSNIITLRITVDGKQHVLAFTAGAASDRFVCGDTRQQSGDGYGFDKVPYDNMVWTGTGIVGGLATRLYTANSGRAMIMNPSANLVGGAKCLRFDTSLKVEMKASSVSTSSFRHYCGAVYYLHP